MNWGSLVVKIYIKLYLFEVAIIQIKAITKRVNLNNNNMKNISDSGKKKSTFE
jgi:hypothetical protein